MKKTHSCVINLSLRIFFLGSAALIVRDVNLSCSLLLFFSVLSLIPLLYTDSCICYLARAVWVVVSFSDRLKGGNILASFMNLSNLLVSFFSSSLPHVNVSVCLYFWGSFLSLIPLRLIYELENS